MLSLFWTGAAVSAYLGYKLLDWWAPAAVVAVVLAGQSALFWMGRWTTGVRARSSSGLCSWTR